MAVSVAVARLDSAKGQLHLFDVTAVASVLERLPIIDIGNDTAVDTRFYAAGAALFGGFSAETWSQYAKKKSRIASRLCRENGELKACIAALENKLRHQSPSVFSVVPNVDPLSSHDPWAGKSISPSVEVHSCLDAWGSWTLATSAASAVGDVKAVDALSTIIEDSKSVDTQTALGLSMTPQSLVMLRQAFSLVIRSLAPLSLRRPFFPRTLSGCPLYNMGMGVKMRIRSSRRQ